MCFNMKVKIFEGPNVSGLWLFAGCGVWLGHRRGEDLHGPRGPCSWPRGLYHRDVQRHHTLYVGRTPALISVNLIRLQLRTCFVATLCRPVFLVFKKVLSLNMLKIGNVFCVLMASSVGVDEVAVIDEIQMIRDPSRGWAWTRALLGLWHT